MFSLKYYYFHFLFLFFVIHCNGNSYKSGFWYGNTQPPKNNYDTVLYANMTMKINHPIEDGPGQNLISDPLSHSNELYVGNTINRQSFDTQFVLDIEYALGINRNRIYVTHVQKATGYYTQEYSSIIIQFIILERNASDVTSKTLLESITDLTYLIQNTSTLLYHGTNVTNATDTLYGLIVRTWDISIKLSYAIDVIGGTAVQDGYFLNQGSLGTCDTLEASKYAYYCEFERFFEDDIAYALNISYYRINIMFIRQAAQDSSIIYFRIVPEMKNSMERNVTAAIVELLSQISNTSSLLYNGNVTIRTDSIWGISGLTETQMKRTNGPLFTYKYYENNEIKLNNKLRMSLMTDYDRCKANRRCNWGMASKLLLFYSFIVSFFLSFY